MSISRYAGPLVIDDTKVTAAGSSPEDFVIGLPNTDLHCHMGGSVPSDTAFDLLNRNGQMSISDRTGQISIHTAEQLGTYFRRPVSGLPEYLERFLVVRSVFDRLQHIPIIIDTIAQRARSENTMYLELRTALKCLDTMSGAQHIPQYSAEAEVESYLDGIRAASTKYNMLMKLILCVRRGRTQEHIQTAIRTVDIARRYREQGVVAVDLVGCEEMRDAQLFGNVFRDAKDAGGLGVTIHAAEVAPEVSAWHAIFDCGADRLGHGVAIRAGSTTAGVVKSLRIPLEVCPTSNIQTGALTTLQSGPYGLSETATERRTTSFADHPIRSLDPLVVPITICTDNRTISHTSIPEELLHLLRTCGFSLTGIVATVRNGINAAFATTEEKDWMMRRLVAYCEPYMAAEAESATA